MAVLVTFRGNVQGVGFRFQTRRVASRYAVTGWVRNEPDGSVKLFLQGPESEVSSVLEEVRDRMRHHIRSEEAREVPDEPGLDGFEVRL